MGSKLTQTMTGLDFITWMDHAGCESAADIVRKLGVSRNRAQEWVVAARCGSNIIVKRSVALAMTATAIPVAPWPDTDIGVKNQSGLE